MIEEAVVTLWEIEIKPLKTYIAFKIANKNFIDIELQKTSLKISLNMPKWTLKDSYWLSKDISEKGHHGNGDYEMTIASESEINSALQLIRQSYEYNGK
jgi:predicted transport protein